MSATRVKTETTRRIVRYGAALLSAAVAVIYFMIGFYVVSVLDGPNPEQRWGLAAGAAYALGTLLLVALDRRFLWVLGAALQVFVIWAYFDVAPRRLPAFEIWGILLRVVQVALLGALVYLAARPSPVAQRPTQGAA